MTQLAQRRAETETKRATAKQAAGAAILDGKKPDLSAIAAFDTELEAIAAAESEKARRDRAAAEQAHHQQQDADRTKLAALIVEQTTDMQEAEAAARALAAALGRLIQRNVEITKLSRSIASLSPLPLQLSEFVSRMACRLSAVMGTIAPNYRARLGSIAWHPGVIKPEQSWRDHEAGILTKHLAPILEKETT